MQFQLRDPISCIRIYIKNGEDIISFLLTCKEMHRYLLENPHLKYTMNNKMTVLYKRIPHKFKDISTVIKSKELTISTLKRLDLNRSTERKALFKCISPASDIVNYMVSRNYDDLTIISVLCGSSNDCDMTPVVSALLGRNKGKGKYDLLVKKIKLANLSIESIKEDPSILSNRNVYTNLDKYITGYDVINNLDIPWDIPKLCGVVIHIKHVREMLSRRDKGDENAANFISLLDTLELFRSPDATLKDLKDFVMRNDWFGRGIKSPLNLLCIKGNISDSDLVEIFQLSREHPECIGYLWRNDRVNIDLLIFHMNKSDPPLSMDIVHTYEACQNIHFRFDHIETLKKTGIMEITHLSSGSERISIKDIISTHKIHRWNWEVVSLRKDVTMEIVLDNPHLPWNMYSLLHNSSITYDDILKNLHLSWPL